MAQGKMKMKAKIPDGVKTKSKKSEDKLRQVRKGAPVKPKLKTHDKKLYNQVEKAIRKNIEENIRVKAGDKV